MDNIKHLQEQTHIIYKEAMSHEPTRKMIEDLERVFGFNGPSITDKGNPNALQALYRGATRDVLNRIHNYSNPEFFDKQKEVKRKA